MLSGQSAQQMQARPFFNDVLASLPAHNLRELLPFLQQVHLPRGTVVQDERGADWVYFLERGIVSIRIRMSDGTIVPITTMGGDGVVGHPFFCGVQHLSAITVVELPVTAWRMSATEFRRLAGASDWLQARVRRYAMVLFLRVAQESACSRFHGTLQRCARLLLTAYDQVGGEPLALTQNLAAQVLGVRRVRVSTAERQLRMMGCIEYARGRVTIRDRERLERAACECYSTLRAHSV